MTDEAEKAWADYKQWRADEGNYRREGDEPSFMAGRASVRDNFSSLRSRIGALEAVISAAFAVEEKNHAAVVGRMRALLSLAPSVVLDEMIREAKAEAVEAARDAIMPPVNWNLRPDGTEMPGTQHIDEALHDIHVQLSAVAAEYRNEER